MLSSANVYTILAKSESELATTTKMCSCEYLFNEYSHSELLNVKNRPVIRSAIRTLFLIDKRFVEIQFLELT